MVASTAQPVTYIFLSESFTKGQMQLHVDVRCHLDPPRAISPLPSPMDCSPAGDDCDHWCHKLTRDMPRKLHHPAPVMSRPNILIQSHTSLPQDRDTDYFRYKHTRYKHILVISIGLAVPKFYYAANMPFVISINSLWAYKLWSGRYAYNGSNLYMNLKSWRRCVIVAHSTLLFSIHLGYHQKGSTWHNGEAASASSLPRHTDTSWG